MPCAPTDVPHLPGNCYICRVRYAIANAPYLSTYQQVQYVDSRTIYLWVVTQNTPANLL